MTDMRATERLLEVPKVWVVVRDLYGDHWSIVGVFASKESADACVESPPADDERTGSNYEVWAWEHEVKP